MHSFSLARRTSVTKTKSEKRSQYLAVGEFDGGQVVNAARGYFLWTIQKEIPDVSIQLREEVLSTFLVAKRHSMDVPVTASASAEQQWKKVLDGMIESQDIENLRRDFQGG